MDLVQYFHVLWIIALLEPTKAQFNEESFYKACATQKVLCFGMSMTDHFDEQCISSKKCDLAVSAFEDPKYPGKVRFQLMGKPKPSQDVNFVGSYISVGLSHDEWMGDDSVVECVSNKKKQIYTSWNMFQQNKRLTDESYISNKWVSQKDKTLFCDFTRDVKSTVEKALFDLEKGNGFHILLAMGNLFPEDKITQHTARIGSKFPLLNPKSIIRHEPPHFSGGQIQKASMTLFAFIAMLNLINQ